jgi:Holliday junction resolvase RusA-like endonuclease
MYTPEETLKYQENFAKEVLYQLEGDEKPMDVPCVVFLATFKKDNRRCDLDNFIKSALDACNEILYTDDYLVVRINAEMEKDSINPRSVIAIMTADEYNKDPVAALHEFANIVEDNRKRYKGKSLSTEV